jgi:predicted small lipoprotein YifL
MGIRFHVAAAAMLVALSGCAVSGPYYFPPFSDVPPIDCHEARFANSEYCHDHAAPPRPAEVAQ